MLIFKSLALKSWAWDLDNSLVRDHPADPRGMLNNLPCKPCSVVEEEEEEEGEKEKRRKNK